MEFQDYKSMCSEFRKHINYRDKNLLNNKRHYTSLDDIEKNLESSQFNIDLKGWHFECFFNESKTNSDYLYVLYNGVQLKDCLPRFPRWAYHNFIPGNMLCMEDPMYYKYPKLTLGWFYGCEEESCIELSVEIIKAVCRKYGINNDKVIFVSSSGGGYDGILAATFLEGSLAIGLNPQLDIKNYVHTKNFVENTGLDLNKHDHFLRNDIPSRIRTCTDPDSGGGEDSYCIQCSV